jgi:hypothetical protein
MVAQCGGAGNVERFHEVANEVAAREPFAEHFQGWSRPWNFASAEGAALLLEAAGFDPVETWLEPSPVTLEEPAAFLRAVCCGPHLERLPEDLRERYLSEVVEPFAADPTLDYVRLNIDARRPE